MSIILLDENASTPATPATNKAILYPKSDGLWYTKDDAGTETAFAIQVPVAKAKELDAIPVTIDKWLLTLELLGEFKVSGGDLLALGALVVEE